MSKVKNQLEIRRLKAHKKRFEVTLTDNQLNDIKLNAQILGINNSDLLNQIKDISAQIRVEIKMLEDRQEPNKKQRESMAVHECINKRSREFKLMFSDALNANCGIDLPQVLKILKYLSSNSTHPKNDTPRQVLINSLVMLIHEFKLSTKQRNYPAFHALSSLIIDLCDAPFKISTDEILKLVSIEINKQK